MSLNDLFRNLEVSDPATHGSLRYLAAQNFEFARRLTTAPLIADEVVAASRDYPVVFTDDGRSLPVAVMSLDRLRSPLVTDDGRWLGGYLPTHLRRYPFILGDDPAAGRFALMIDRDAPQFTTDPDLGEPLYVDGQPPEGGIIRRARQMLASYMRGVDDTARLTRPLQESGILVPSSLTRTRDGRSELAVGGFRIVDRTALLNLPDATLGRWLRSGLLGLIEAHCNSLDRVSRLEALEKSALSQAATPPS